MGVSNFENIASKIKENHATLVAVSKNKPIADIEKLYQTGHLDFGENYVQELMDKQKALPHDIRWHFIGHLQRNKVKLIVPFIHCIQSVDSERLLLEIEKESAKCSRVTQVFLQIHLAQEKTKFGLSFDAATQLLKQYNRLKHVQINGLMAMATLTEDKSVLSAEFQSMQSFFEKIKTDFPSVTYLSMGMSSDFDLALQYGSNMVRVGSAIFGARDKQKVA